MMIVKTCLLWKQTYKGKKIIVITSNELLKDQLQDELKTFTDTDDVPVFLPKEVSFKLDDCVVVIDEADQSLSDGVLVFGADNTLKGLRSLKHAKRVFAYSATWTESILRTIDKLFCPERTECRYYQPKTPGEVATGGKQFVFHCKVHDTFEKLWDELVNLILEMLQIKPVIVYMAELD